MVPASPRGMAEVVVSGAIPGNATPIKVPLRGSTAPGAPGTAGAGTAGRGCAGDCEDGSCTVPRKKSLAIPPTMVRFALGTSGFPCVAGGEEWTDGTAVDGRTVVARADGTAEDGWGGPDETGGAKRVVSKPIMVGSAGAPAEEVATGRCLASGTFWPDGAGGRDRAGKNSVPRNVKVPQLPQKRAAAGRGWPHLEHSLGAIESHHNTARACLRPLLCRYATHFQSALVGARAAKVDIRLGSRRRAPTAPRRSEPARIRRTHI
jgi:hypothetical protein